MLRTSRSLCNFSTHYQRSGGFSSQEKEKKKNTCIPDSSLVQIFPVLPQYCAHVTSLFSPSLTRVLKKTGTTVRQHKHDHPISTHAREVRPLLRVGLGHLEVDHGGCHEQQHIHSHASDKALQSRAYAETHRPEEEASGAVLSQQHFSGWTARAGRCG